MKLSTIIDPAFQAALKKLMAEPLPLKTAYKIKAIAQAVDQELKRYDEVRREALLKRATHKEDGEPDVNSDGTVKLEGDNLQLFVKELNELLAVDIAVEMLTIAELGDKVCMSADQLLALDDLIS
jgi:hypothetical protein